MPAPGETVKLTLNADKGGSEANPDTRVYVGQVSGSKVRYYWNEEDQIGVIPFLTDAKPNYVTKETQINQGDKNLAQFEAYITAEGYNTAAANLLIYYPYNSSMLEGTTGSDGQAYAKAGLTFRLPQQQEQYGYNRSLVGESDSDVNEHPSVWALSNYGLAYDLATTAISTETDGNQTIANATGEFKLDHANTYFQFNVYGTQSQTSGKHYGDGTWKIASLILEVGHCEIATDEMTGETVYSMTDQVAIAGTYKFKYTYSASDFANVAGTSGNDKITLSTVAGASSVKVNMNNVEAAPALGASVDKSVPAFAVINTMDIKNNPKGNLNCLKAVVTCYKYDANGNLVGSDTRSRYYNIGDFVGQDLSGNYYTIDFEVCDPVESYTDLSVAGNANCYIISAPGNYSFNLDVAGNGKAPYGGFTAGFDPTNLIDANTLDEINSKYGFDWLWASGLSFDRITGVTGDANIVRKIVNSVGFTGETGQVSIGLNDAAENLSGNIVLALYEKNTDGSVKQILWTWHLWLGNPQTQHYKFPSTNYNWQYTNEDWYILDRNIGAESAEFTTPGDPNGARSNGLYYQRGRKEPMIGFQAANGSSDWKTNQLPTYRNTETFGSLAVWKADVAYSNYNTFSQPMSLIKNIPYTTDYVSQPEKDYTFAWNSSTTIAVDENDVNNDTKSMFDPCPVGYRMPTTREWDNMKADKYRYTIGGQDFGVYGYCVWEGLANKLSASSTDERVQTYIQHLATDKYTVNDQYERTYYINANSGTGSEIVTYFPNTGTLNHSGEWASTYQGSWTTTTPTVTVQHPKGPSVTGSIETKSNVASPQITNSSLSYSSSRFSPSFSVTSGKIYYSVGEDNPNTTSSFNYNDNCRIYPGRGTSSGRNIYLNMSNMSTNSTVTVYFYLKDGNNVSDPTTVTVTKISNSYTATYVNGNATANGSYLVVTFSDGAGDYAWAEGTDGTKTWFTGSTLNIPCSSLTYSRSSGSYVSTVYLYYNDSNGIISAATTIAVTRSGNGTYTYTAGAASVGNAYTETTGGNTETFTDVANMVLWSSGRVGETTNSAGNRKFSQYWFGPAADTSDGWATEINGDWGHTTNNGKNTAPFTESRETHLFGINVFDLGDYDTNAGNGFALPVRCIREYDNASVQAE